MRRRFVAITAAVSAVASMAGCGPGIIAPHARDNDVGDLAKAMALQGAPRTGPVNASGRPFVYVVTGATPREIVAFDLESKKVAWTHAAQPISRLMVGPRGVYARVEDHAGTVAIAGWDAGDGHPLFDAATGLRGQLLGLAADAMHVYCVVQGEEGGRRVSHLTAIDAMTGARAWDMPAPGTLGAPAVRGSAVFVPYLSQYLTIVDATRGEEMARIRVKDEEVSFVRALAEGVYYGSTGVFTLDDKSIAGTRSESTYLEAVLPPFVRPVYALNGYDPVECDYSAYDRNRLLWRGASAGGFGGGTVVVHNYRYLFGFDAKKGELKWAYSQPKNDLVSAEDTGPAIVFVSSEGEVGTIDVGTGAAVALGSVGERVAGAAFDADGFRAPSGGTAVPLEQALGTIIWDPDARFTSVKLFAIDALARIPGKQVSTDLVKIVEDPKLGGAVGQHAGMALVARKDRDALPLYLQELGIHWGYLDRTQPHAVGVLARAAAALGAKDAVPALLTQLQDPATPEADVSAIAQALTQIADAQAVPVFRSYLLEYRADPLFQVDPTALNAVADGLLALGGAEDRALLRYVAEDPRTLAKVRAYIERALAATPAAGMAPARGTSDVSSPSGG